MATGLMHITPLGIPSTPAPMPKPFFSGFRSAAWVIFVVSAYFCLPALGVTISSSVAPAAATSAAPAPVAPGPVSSERYQVNLSPPFKVGQKFSLAANVTSKMQMHMAITLLGVPTLGPSKSEASSVQLEAEGEVLAIFPNGSPQKISLTLKSLAATKDAKPVPHLPTAGAVIVAEALPPEEKSTRAVAPATNPPAENPPASKKPAETPASKNNGGKDPPSPGLFSGLQAGSPRVALTIDGTPASDDLTFAEKLSWSGRWKPHPPGHVWPGRPGGGERNLVGEHHPGGFRPEKIPGRLPERQKHGKIGQY